jgi:hypothetical protein
MLDGSSVTEGAPPSGASGTRAVSLRPIPSFQRKISVKPWVLCGHGFSNVFLMRGGGGSHGSRGSAIACGFFRSARNFVLGVVLVCCVRASEAHQIKPKNKTMKTNTLIVIAAALGLAGAAHAEEGKPQRPHREMPPGLLKQFDKDGDGKLNDEEREAAKAAREAMMEARKKEMLEKFDTDKDGELNDAEKEAMRAEMKKRMLEKFDKDGNGELSDEEKAEMRKAMMDRPGAPHGPGGKRGPGAGDRKRPQGGGDKEAPGAGE